MTSFIISKVFQTFYPKISSLVMSNPASIALLISQCNEAIQGADTLWTLKDKGVPLETIIDQCKSICAIGVCGH